MANTYIDTARIPRTAIAGAGEVAEILNNQLAGAKNVVARLHWLHRGDHLDAGEPDFHHLLYLMEGEATIVLDGADHRVAKGAGVYLAPAETARIAHAGSAPLKLFHLTVPRL
ncbi:MAG TPA: AraC family ligand binding domain-containing protein [Vicinamibacterales bacterium]|nr:AraC family ligand binding domain-containing protein [Vicinamibacterales bacterium]